MASACGSHDEIEDIEDMVVAGDSALRRIPGRDNKVLPRALRKKNRSHFEGQPVCDSFIPGSHLIYIKTWGCSHNTSDGEYMAGLLSASGYSIVGMWWHSIVSVGLNNGSLMYI